MNGQTFQGSENRHAERNERLIEVTILDGSPASEAWLLLPRPIDDWTQRFSGVELGAVAQVHEICALNSRQHAYLVKPAGTQAPTVRYRLAPPIEAPADWIWQLEDNRYTRASAELASMAVQLLEKDSSQRRIVGRLVEHTAGLFGYDHPEERFNHGLEEVPALCGTTKGSCVDINTYLIAAARSLGIRVQYMAGYWFHPERSETHDMHCWLAFRLDGEAVFWDLAHHLKWGVPTLSPGLNPAGGRRVTMSCGRGIRFDTPNGQVEISHFSEPAWVLPGGVTRRPQLRIRITEAGLLRMPEWDPS